ncbi:unnamed protein product [Brachionus calyciflorus]|uniref:Ceramide phosphoethanolamine synthase n=1 Tax=Brachionus calyciflorus TaxID=104777 RepID=A0A813VZ61_9BILA|nr:unnamed protein product [Brachionus calyciflorus]
MIPSISLNNNLIVSSLNNNYKFVFFGLILIIYFAWMDIALFINLQRWSPQIQANTTQTIKYNYVDPFSVFKPLSVKLVMIDHVTHYVHDILARFIEDTLHFTTLFPWVTANFVSYAGLLSALIGSRLIISDNTMYCKLGAILFELRNLADSLDGVVYRSRKRREELLKQDQASIGVYQSNYGSYGYNVDVICDGLGGLFFCTAILIKFLKHLPSKAPSNILIRRPRSDNSNYKYDRLQNEEPPKYEMLQMEYTTDQASPTHQRSKSLEYSEVFAQTSSSDIQPTASRRHLTSFQVKLIVVSFGFRLLFTGLIWDHFVHKYHVLLMEFSDNPYVRRMQEQAFKSISMWLVMWFWRLGNACAILEHLSITTFFGKLWDYLVFTNYVGWVYLIVLSLFTQMHYTELYQSLNKYSALV